MCVCACVRRQFLSCDCCIQGGKKWKTWNKKIFLFVQNYESLRCQPQTIPLSGIEVRSGTRCFFVYNSRDVSARVWPSSWWAVFSSASTPIRAIGKMGFQLHAATRIIKKKWSQKRMMTNNPTLSLPSPRQSPQKLFLFMIATVPMIEVDVSVCRAAGTKMARAQTTSTDRNRRSAMH